MAANEPGIAPAPVQIPPLSALSVSEGSPQYEFSETENSIISNLGSRMSFIGLFMLGIGVLSFLTVMRRWFQFQFQDLEILLLLFVTLLLIPIGIWTNGAGREFRSVADTEGKDISHLMGALENLLKLCTVVYIILLISLIFAVIQLGAYCL